MSKRPAYQLPADHKPIPATKVGILLINLGTPEATSYWPMRRYLKEFLSDARVIETNRALWWVILNGIILTTRPKKSGHAYDQIWNRELDESPLKTITRGQSQKLAESFSGNPDIMVDWAMRYGHPSTPDVIGRMKDAGCDRILLCPLYPQYAAATTATAMDKAFDALKAMRWQPAIRSLPPYYDHPAYIRALSQSLKAHLKTLDWQPDRIVASFHGLPEDYLIKGDPYHCHCQKTARLLREAMNLPQEKFIATFQSRFGKAEWLKPYTDKTIEQLAKDGAKNIVVITPGFSADCVETLEEIAIGVAEMFHEHGGENFSVAPCLNDSKLSVNLLTTLAKEELAGWI
ncbi:MAG: ferrochelatase [Rhizobiales bacterium]|nr:ferrochelatase [Hyphomicrobiales bacterium]